MYVKRTGEGPRAFFAVHGWAGNHRTFRRLTAGLPEDVSFFAVDLPGYGDSPPPTEWTMDRIVEDLAATARGHVDGPMTLMGNCAGALVALEMALVSDLPVERLILIDPFGYIPWYFDIFTWGEFGRRAYYSTFANPTGRWVTNNVLRRKRQAGTNLTTGFRQVDHETVHRYLALLCSLGTAERYRGLDVPADVVYGQRTFAAVKKSLKLWDDVLPRVRFYELEGAGHEPIREATAQLARIAFEPETVRAEEARASR